MKIRKYISIMFLALTASHTFTACSDEDSLGEAPRLFRPVTSLEVKNNNLVATWENIKEATDYILELYRVTGTDDQDNNTYELLSEVSCQSSPYTFEGLDWDEKYMVKIKCKGMGKESEQYQTLDANIAYISRLSETKAIDNAVRISWKEASSSNADIIKAIKVVEETPAPDAATRTEGEDGSETAARIEYVSEAELTAGYKDIFNLSPETKYTFYAYKDNETLDNSTYAGKLSATTTTTPNFEELFPNGYVDLRKEENNKSNLFEVDNKDFWENLPEGTGIILAGGIDYKVSGGNNQFSFPTSVTFMTGPTLDANARIVINTSFDGAQNDINKIEFNNVDICAEKVTKEKDEITYIKNASQIGFSGTHMFQNGKGIIQTLSFKNCNIIGFRTVIRFTNTTQHYQNILFDGCTFNGIGDYGLVNNDGKNGKSPDLQNIKLKDCTILNTGVAFDIRSAQSTPTIDIENCTFCYAPTSTTGASFVLFRFDNQTINMNIAKTLFGPTMSASDDGKTIQTYTAGDKGSFLLKGKNVQVSAKNSYKTNFAWAENSGSSYPIDGLLPLDFDEKSLWQDPENGDFKVIGIIGEDGIGASKWLQ